MYNVVDRALECYLVRDEDLGVFENNLTTSISRELITVLSESIEKLPLDNGLPLFVLCAMLPLAIGDPSPPALPETADRARQWEPIETRQVGNVGFGKLPPLRLEVPQVLQTCL